MLFREQMDRFLQQRAAEYNPGSSGQSEQRMESIR